MKIGISKVNANVSFKGHSLVTNPNGKKEYQFYLPTQQKVQPEVVLIDKDGKTENVTSQLSQKKNATVPIWSLPVSKTLDKTVAYRFKQGDKYIYDETVKVSDKKGNEYNEAIKSSRPALEMPKQMYHLMPDSFAANNGKIQKDENGVEIQRNHVNKFGGTIADVANKISEVKELGAKRIISTPIYGNDTISNHGYWTQNPYQLTSTLGNINDFKNLQVELLKNGMSWVADGAFANEGLGGIHMQDIMRWGEKSPYINWFDTKDFNSYGFKFGVLPPTGSEAEKYYDFKIVNSPVVYAYDENGKPVENFGKKNPNYDSSKATYLQQFDTRLMDKNYINTDELLTAYTKKQTNNLHEIKNYKDSVQLFAYQLDPEAVAKKVSQMSKIKVGNPVSTHSAYRDMLKEWDNFTLNNVDKDATIRNWTGKKDIVALNYKNPEVQKYIINTVKYWTNETDKVLTTHVAKDLANAEDKKAVLENLAKVSGAKLDAEELQNMINGQYEVKLAPAKDNVKDELKDFPLLAAELPAEVQSLLSDKNVTDSKAFNNAYETVSNAVSEIFKSQHPEAFDGEKLTNDGSQLFRLVSSDVMRYVTAYALSGETPAVEVKNGITNVVLPENFNDKVLHNINLESSTREEAIAKLENAFSNGAKAFANDENAKNAIAQIVKNSTENVNANDVKMAKAIISKLELGLDHRIDASKDIMDLDLINQNKVEAQKSWDVVQNFWKDFVSEIREYNPKSYIIGEVTSLWDFFGNEANNVEKNFIKETGFTTQTNYSYLFNIYSQLVHGAPEPCNEWHQNAQSLNGNIKNFTQSGYADNIRYSHEGVDNHDKPRAAHGFAIDINNFFNVQAKNAETVKNMPEFKTVAKVYRETVDANATDDAIVGELCGSIVNEISTSKAGSDYSLFSNNKGIMDKLFEKENGLEEYYEYTEALNNISLVLRDSEKSNVVRDALIESVDNAKLNLSKEQIAKIKDAINTYSKGGSEKSEVVAEHFKTRPFNYVIEDAVKGANLGLNEEETEKVCASIHNAMMKPAFEKYKAMLEIMVAAPGNPTIFAGDEYGETGFETPGNNVYQHNRNQIHRGWAVDNNRPEFKAFHEEFVKTFNMRNKACFRPFVDGDMIVLDNIKDGDNNVSGLYRYNKNSDVITVLNTNGFDNRRNASKVETVSVAKIPVNAQFSIDNAYGSNEFVHVDKNGQEIKDGYYRVEGNNLVKYEDASFKKVAKAGIALTAAATYFVRKIAPSMTNAYKQALCSLK
ncbi:hypothetical protein IJ732_05385 [bacterium]|nr:hypothetical protein [bacterium]